MSTTLTRGIEAPDYDDIRPRELWSEILPGLWQGGTDDDDIIGNDKFAKPASGVAKKSKSARDGPTRTGFVNEGLENT